MGNLLEHCYLLRFRGKSEIRRYKHPAWNAILHHVLCKVDHFLDLASSFVMAGRPKD